MKFFGFIAVLITTFFGSCNESKVVLKITPTFTRQINGDSIEYVQNILESRNKAYNIDCEVEFKNMGSHLLAIFPSNCGDLDEFIKKNTTENKGIQFEPILPIDEEIQKKLISRFNLKQYPNRKPSICTIKDKDTLLLKYQIKKFLNQELPDKDFKLIWVEPFINGSHELNLYCIKNISYNTKLIVDKHVNKAKVIEGSIGISFNEEGTDILSNLTSENIGNHICIYLNNIVLACPKVNDSILDGELIISGNFRIQELEELVDLFNARSVPYDLLIEEEK